MCVWGSAGRPLTRHLTFKVTMKSASSGRAPFSPTRTLVFGTLAVGTVDICWAFFWTAVGGHGPVYVLQSVAGGWLGAATYDRGVASAFLGMFTHFFIAGSVVTTYFLVSRKVARLAERPWVFGPLYGILVYVIMNQLVLPLSAWHSSGIHVGPALWKGLFIHMFGIGLITALVTRRGTAGAYPG